MELIKKKSRLLEKQVPRKKTVKHNSIKHDY